jgi:hypothetical protein
MGLCGSWGFQKPPACGGVGFGQSRDTELRGDGNSLPLLSRWVTSRSALRRTLLVAPLRARQAALETCSMHTEGALLYWMAQMTYGLDGGRGGQRATRKKDAKSDTRESVLSREKRNRAQQVPGACFVLFKVGLSSFCQQATERGSGAVVASRIPCTDHTDRGSLSYPFNCGSATSQNLWHFTDQREVQECVELSILVTNQEEAFPLG